VVFGLSSPILHRGDHLVYLDPAILSHKDCIVKAVVFDGIYLLPEFQPVYDFENDEFSFWAGPEFGKILSAGNVVYVKPGWGVDAEAGEREFTFEAGWRWFF